MTWAVARLGGRVGALRRQALGLRPVPSSPSRPFGFDPSRLRAALALAGRMRSCFDSGPASPRRASRVLRLSSLRWVAWCALFPHAGGQIGGGCRRPQGAGPVLVDLAGGARCEAPGGCRKGFSRCCDSDRWRKGGGRRGLNADMVNVLGLEAFRERCIPGVLVLS